MTLKKDEAIGNLMRALETYCRQNKIKVELNAGFKMRNINMRYDWVI